jgi:hypothetical protein
VQKSISISMKQIGGTVFAHASTRQHARAARPTATSDSSEIDIKNIVYSNSRTPVHNVCVVTCVHATPAVTAGVKRRETGKAPEVPTHERRSWWWHGEEDNKSARLQIQSQSSASLPLRLRGNVRSTIRVRIGVGIRLGLYVTCTPSLYLPPCTSIYTPTRSKQYNTKY